MLIHLVYMFPRGGQGTPKSTSYMSHGVALRSQSVALSQESLPPTMHSMGDVMCLAPRALKASVAKFIVQYQLCQIKCILSLLSLYLSKCIIIFIFVLDFFIFTF